MTSEEKAFFSGFRSGLDQGMTKGRLEEEKKRTELISQAILEEREACAKMCESLLTNHGSRKGGSNTGDAARRVCAAAIRNREIP